ncbi:hypothetical protein M3612_16415 [Niallia taxi]|uniref:hypothetical protein n=1 Tax=Niallia taxi TaxID=2499688 RepID=UPI00203AA4AE|nr:hypothetical protein [Niallia taxi]MCM3216083.1 hypothetical protein [Niallia taxi]
MNRTTEYTLSKVATIILSVEGIIGAIIAFFLGFEPVTHKISIFFFTYLFIYSILSLPLIVLAWKSIDKIRENNYKWGMFTLVIGVFYTFSLYFLPGVLLLISGILMVTKNNRDKTKIQA